MDGRDQVGLEGNAFPFSAIVGQERVKKAFLCAMLSPDINSLLIMGDKGTAKSTIVRSLDGLFNGKKIINLPLNAMEECIVGSIDIEKSLLSGSKSIQPGLLYDAHKQLLFIDNINLLDNSLLNTVLNVLQSGTNFLEREGMSWSHDSDFTLLGTMDPSEADLSSHLMDKFTLCVYMSQLSEPALRKEVLCRNLDYEKDPVAFRKKYEDELDELKSKVIESQERLPYVIMPDGHMEIICQLVTEMGVHGHRGEIAVSRTACALAALEGREQVLMEDIKEAAVLALEHRSNQIQAPCSPKQQSGNEQDSNSPEDQANEPESKQEEDNFSDTGDNPSESDVETSPDVSNENNEKNKGISSGFDSEQVFSIGRTFTVIDYLSGNKSRISKKSSSRGKNNQVISSDKSGRYVSFRYPKGKIKDIAFDATLRASAPYQKLRKRGNLSVALEKSDFREKVRLRKKGTTILFLVDSSSSMGVRKRMSAVKGAIISLLMDAYQKRDSVGLMSFFGDSSELLLPPTRSLDLAYNKLRELPTGGKTPLAEALSKSLMHMTSLKSRTPWEDVVIVLVSDCRANVSLNGGNAFEDAIAVARRAVETSTRFIVVDTEAGYPRLGLASRLAAALGGTYFRLDELDSELLAASVHSVVHKN
ncbi:VWA domain-containing protein [uncultured Methanolobus sp.]|uniref:VWA domain-containing protein n=1 Tax=uncultured Methanolobus sp. TaxID=218300 RepID=UPI002AAAC623|nr:VWA domain-containing protein [uncultured Methanolobus sp.]